MVMKEDLCSAMNARMVGPTDSGKETIVLAHGYGGDQSVWDKILPYLTARGHPVVVFDWCFSGAVRDPNLYDASRYGSYDAFADDLICVADEMKLKSTVFVGHSMSGMIGCIASVKRPDLFSRLVLVSSSPRFLNLEGYEGGFAMSQIEQLISSIESNFQQWASTFAYLVVDASDPHSITKFETSLKRMSREVALPLAKIVFLSDFRDILDKVVLLCDIIQTRNDIVVPKSVPYYMQSRIKAKSEVHIIDIDGHFPQLTAHIQFVEVLNRILEC